MATVVTKRNWFQRLEVRLRQGVRRWTRCGVHYIHDRRGALCVARVFGTKAEVTVKLGPRFKST